MRIIRFVSGDQTLYGRDMGNGEARRIEGDILGAYEVTTELVEVDEVLCPIVPTDILCIGLNYRAHAAESNSAIPENPVLFIKTSNTLNHPNKPIAIPKRSKDIDFEAELAIVIGRTAKHVSKENALKYVLGYTCANDVSARDWQRKKELGGGQFARGKSFDGFCPIGPAIVTTDEITNPNKLRVRGLLNGQVMQDSNTSDMIFSVESIIESLSSTMTLKAGSIILTGTPSGVGFARTPAVWLKAGDKFTVEIDQIGKLENPVIDE